MFDYGWRQYMPDLGRWNGIDQLSESYISTSPYAYVANNPVSQYDVDGRWFNQDGTIDTSGRTPGFTTGRQYYNSFLGINPGDGGDANSMSAAGLIDTAFGLGGTWSNTGFGFMDSDGTLLGYNGSYKSLNVNFEEGGIGEATNYVPEVFVTGRKGGGFFEGSYNSFKMENGLDNARQGWNLSQSRSLLYDAIENTKVGQSVSAAENFMFLELPASLAGGELLAAGWRAAGAGRYLGQAFNYISKGGPTFAQYRAAYWAKNAKPVLQALENPETGQVWKQSMELHHRFIPQRAKWAPNWLLNNRFNLQSVSSLEHAIADPYRARFAPKWVKEMYNLTWK